MVNMDIILQSISRVRQTTFAGPNSNHPPVHFHQSRFRYARKIESRPYLEVGTGIPLCHQPSLLFLLILHSQANHNLCFKVNIVKQSWIGNSMYFLKMWLWIMIYDSPEPPFMYYAKCLGWKGDEGVGPGWPFNTFKILGQKCGQFSGHILEPTV